MTRSTKACCEVFQCLAFITITQCFSQQRRGGFECACGGREGSGGGSGSGGNSRSRSSSNSTVIGRPISKDIISITRLPVIQVHNPKVHNTKHKQIGRKERYSNQTYH